MSDHVCCGCREQNLQEIDRLKHQIKGMSATDTTVIENFISLQNENVRLKAELEEAKGYRDEYRRICGDNREVIEGFEKDRDLWKSKAEKLYACLKVYDGPNFDVYKNKTHPLYVMGTKEALTDYENGF